MPLTATPPQRGRVYRRCGCRRPDGRQFGTACPKLQGKKRHGSWAFAVDLPSVDRRRRPRLSATAEKWTGNGA